MKSFLPQPIKALQSIPIALSYVFKEVAAGEDEINKARCILILATMSLSNKDKGPVNVDPSVGGEAPSSENNPTIRFIASDHVFNPRR